MPNGQPAQLANLQPAFGPKNLAPRSSAHVLRSITKCRKLSPETVDIVAAIMRDPNEPSTVRLRACEIILDKAIPGPRARDDRSGSEERPRLQFIEVIFHDPKEALQAKPNGHDTFAVSFDAE